MTYDIQGRNGFVPSEAIKDYVKKRLSKIIDFFEPNLIKEVNVVMKVYKDHHRVEITIPSPYIVLRSEVSDPDMYAAVDKSIDKLNQQIRKYRTKIKKQIKDKTGIKDIFTKEFDAEALEKDILASQLVKKKKIEITEMLVDDAITQMELVDHDFFIFIDKNTKEPMIVYRRNDGDYAVIHATTSNIPK